MEFLLPEVAVEVSVESKRLNDEAVGKVEDIDGTFEEVVDEAAKLADWETELSGLRGRMREGKEEGMVLVKLDEPVLASMSTTVVSFTWCWRFKSFSSFLFSFLSLEIASFLILQVSTRSSFFLAMS